MANIKVYLIFFTVLNTCLLSNGQYVGVPSTKTRLRAVLKHSFELICQYTGDDDGRFTEWFRDNSSVALEKPGHYVVKNTPKESKLTIKIFVKSDAEIKKWSVRTSNPNSEEPAACRFGRIFLKSSPQSIETNRERERMDTTHGSVRRTEGETISFKCLIEYSPTDKRKSNKIQWQFSKDDNKYSSELPPGVEFSSEDQILINKVKKIHRGYYRCTLNDVSFTALLRVKDRLAALWPFLGIVAIVLVLVVIILISEQRRRATKQSNTSTQDNDNHANEPLVRSTNKSTDIDNKKRAVKA